VTKAAEQPTAPAEEPAAPADDTELWYLLGTAVKAASLPAPTCVELVPDGSAVVWLQHHEPTDLYTWVAWLGAQRVESPPGVTRVERFRGTRCGRTVDVVLIRPDTEAAV